MSSYLDELEYPPVAQMALEDQEMAAWESWVIATAIKERASLLRATGHRGVELAVVELETIAERIMARSGRYQASRGDQR
jgi:hypothetical protein